MHTIPENAYLLLVDDEEMDRDLAIKAISKTRPGLSIVVASHGEEALDFLIQAHIQKNLPVIAIIDLQMPIMDGIELLRAIHDYQLPAFPKVLMSMMSDPVKVETASHLGVSAFYEKPMSYRDTLALFAGICHTYLNSTISVSM